ncbi:hypothetical protein D8Y22_07970 [Salinadaptatus halalkaliphilus]|uniref:Putative asparagine synthetase [glutamine-hydrolyzing] n=1 Tax=Salinadaptatus halalkaliphilus TaxID=2419781 RepID=A0A4S3TNE1_9EURY|nr:asparagine synthase-related protein [Salinadaptatus halalkaliphilus]THE65150.1 hypothetical protein D8Y22_07970 [Salinadaptatus halalkaliphilus]
MSGIVACYRRTGEPIESTLLERLCERQRHRGPDGDGRWCDGHVGLGQQLLETTPESRYAALPTVDGDLALTADVRLDNRDELIATLELAGDPSRMPDGRLLLEAYREWGADCPSRLLGAFAFVVWDRDRGQLYCARDHVGVKPLYYYADEAWVVIASELPTLFELPALESVPDRRWIGNYLAGQLTDERATGYQRGGRLPPAHTLTVTETGSTRRRYWSVEDIDPLPPVSDDRYRRRFRDLFEDAVADRLRHQQRVGSLLSGGIDSSSIASVATQLRTDRNEPALPTFSAIFEDVPSCDEREFVEAVTAAGRFEPHYVRGDGFGPLADIDTVLEGFGRPFYPSLFMLVPRLYARASTAGVRAVLHGYGGDQVMGSDVRGYFRGLARRGNLLTLGRELRSYRRRYPWLSWTDVIWRDVLTSLVPEPLRRVYHARYDADRYLEQTIASIDQSFARRIDLDERLERARVRRPPDSQRALRQRALTRGEPTFNLELNDAAAAAVGVEPRYPYFDKRIVEFALALPPGETVVDGLDRTIVRDGLAGILPRAIRERDDKTEFSRNVVYGATRYDREYIDRTLFRDRPSIAPYVDLAGLEDAFENLRTGRASAGDARNLSMATTLERWHRDESS